MIPLKTWDALYRHNLDWALSCMEPTNEQDWLLALKVFNKLQNELFNTYAVIYKKSKCIKGLELTADQLFDLFHNHLNQYDNYIIKNFIFHWWNDLRYYVEGAQPTLNYPLELIKDATKEEIEQANKDFAHYECEHTFNNGIVLEYRNIRFPIDDQWYNAWFKKKDGTIKCFNLEWDYWFPIDECLDLYN